MDQYRDEIDTLLKKTKIQNEQIENLKEKLSLIEINNRNQSESNESWIQEKEVFLFH